MSRRLIFSIGLAVLLIAVLVLALAYKGGGNPETTVSRFLKALEERNATMLSETLSPEARNAGDLAETLSPDSLILVYLKNDITLDQLTQLENSIWSIPEVKSASFTPREGILLSRLKGNASPAEFRIHAKEPKFYWTVVQRLRNEPGIAVDPKTGEKEIILPISSAAGDFISQVLKDLRFGDLKYKSKVKGDDAVVIIQKGIITKLGEKGKRVPLDPTELERLSIIPTRFVLEKIDDTWYITSFPAATA